MKHHRLILIRWFVFPFGEIYIIFYLVEADVELIQKFLNFGFVLFTVTTFAFIDLKF